MTAPDSNTPHTVIQGRKGSYYESESAESGYSATEYSNNTGSDEWTNNSKQPSLANTISTNNANFTHILNKHGNTNSEENTGETSYFDMQKNPYFQAGYPDARAYYGWLPAGFSPMRLPALIYPHSFLGFAPTVAWMKNNDNATGRVENIEKIDRWKGKHGASSISSETSQGSQDSTAITDKDKVEYDFETVREKTQSIHSDEDEGLVLDERETLKRRRQKEIEKLQTQTIRPQPERSSVIQENVSVQAKPSVVTHVQDSSTNDEQEQIKSAKRGRASTRQIEKTDQYWDRRKKNNVSAKKSRDARRQREALINQRSAVLETENLRVRAELATLREENTRLKRELNSLKK
ncbi:thyrotroph embryonic factor-like [Paramuricea clavata]|uniref:Thyrotroph embryonic factor-like n=1 Tax=Paramuricea clavata TaxID=317549 RepID=A0A7D9L689_PARCT|nr:thyrotroph embryonic factor-like [Paramuricea clavata]